MTTGKACCFLGHRKIKETPELIERLAKEIEVLITEKRLALFILVVKVNLMTYAIKSLQS